MNYLVGLMIGIVMTCAIALVYRGAVVSSDPDNSFGQLEFAVAAMALLCSAITISYFGVVYVVLQ